MTARKRSRRQRTLSTVSWVSAIVAVFASLLAVVGPTGVASGAKTCPGAKYTVVKGDYWVLIATKTHTYTQQLRALNNATRTTKINPGEVLCLPPSPVPTTTTTPTTASPPAPVAASGSPAACPGATYEVVAHDGWSIIAKRLKVSVNDLYKANGANPKTRLDPGQIICQPTTSAPATISATGMPAACPGATYEVVAHDGWSIIAKKLLVSVNDLYKANGANPKTRLDPGQIICQPTPAAPTTTPPPTTAPTATTTPAPAAPTIPDRCTADAIAGGNVLCVNQAARKAWGLTFASTGSTCQAGTSTLPVAFGSTNGSLCIHRTMSARTGRNSINAKGSGCSATDAGHYPVTGKALSVQTKNSSGTTVQINNAIFFNTSKCTWLTSVHTVIDPAAVSAGDLSVGSNSGWISLLPADSDWMYGFLSAGDDVRLVGAP